MTTIGYAEPTLWAAVALASVIAMVAGHITQYHRGLVCTAFVAPVLLIPALIGVAVESRAWRRAREARVE